MRERQIGFGRLALPFSVPLRCVSRRAREPRAGESQRRRFPAEDRVLQALLGTGKGRVVARADALIR